MNEEELVSALKNGDRNAYRLFVHSYQEKIINTCYSFLKNMEEAEDLAQEIFIELLTAIQEFREDSKLSTWIYRISVNRSLNRIRKLKRQSFFQSINPFTNQDIMGRTTENPENDLKEKELNNALDIAMRSLSDKQRTAFSLNRYQDLSYKEISEIMNLSVASVESLIFRAKEKLKLLMKEFLNN
jgi:RNA polymerase sigma-70 factor, ECF subfamily